MHSRPNPEKGEKGKLGFYTTLMASSAAAKTTATNTTLCPSLPKTVYLNDWWLIKVEIDSKDWRLGVGGFAFIERQPTRAFHSAAIAKMHDAVTLETADGITITISGCINRSRTLQNGFPSKVCNCFLFGFPYYWEDYAGRFSGEESANGAIPSWTSSFSGFNISSNGGTDSSPPVSLDDLPVTLVRDLLMSSPGDSGNCVLRKNILNDLLQKCAPNSSIHNRASVQSSIQIKCPRMMMDSVSEGTPGNCMETNTGKQKIKEDHCTCPLMTRDSVHYGTPKRHNKTKVRCKRKDAGCVGHSTESVIEEYQKIIPECEMCVDASSLRVGVTTRRMTRLNNSRNKPEKNLSPNTSCRLTESCSVLVASRNRQGGMVNRGNETILSGAEVEAMEIQYNSTFRRSIRLKSASDPFSTPEASKNQYGGLVFRRNDSDARSANISSRKEMDAKQIPDKSAVRRSNRLRNLNK